MHPRTVDPTSDLDLPQRSGVPAAFGGPTAEGAPGEYRPRHAAPPRPDAPDEPTASPVGRAVLHLLRTAVLSTEAHQRLEPVPDARLRLTSATSAAPLVVHDDGLGLTPDQVRALLRPDEPVRAQRDAGVDLDAVDEMLRAALRIAYVVEVRTRVAGDPQAPTYSAIIRPDSSVRVGVAGEPLARPGTELRVHPREPFRDVLGAPALHRFVEAVADLVAVPVEVDGEPLPTAGPVWGLSAEEQLEWCTRRFGPTLAVLPLGAGPHGTRALAVIGAEGSQVGLEVHAGGLRVADGPASLRMDRIPFCRVVLDAGDLPLDATGDGLADGPAADTVRGHLERAVLSELVLLTATDPARWRAVVEAHHDALAEALGTADLAGAMDAADATESAEARVA